MLFRQIEEKRRIVVEFLIPIEIPDVGIAKDGGRGQTDTRKDEEAIVQLETMTSLQLQDKASQRSEHRKAIEEINQRLLTAVSRR